MAQEASRDPSTEEAHSDDRYSLRVHSLMAKVCLIMPRAIGAPRLMKCSLFRKSMRLVQAMYLDKVNSFGYFALVIPYARSDCYPSLQPSFRTAAGVLHHQVIVCGVFLYA
jgi:hypothetical protein